MSKVIAVIGAGYGDEGKGLMTDYHAYYTADNIVIRSNGGAQAGHTVVTPDGDRNVFSHIGSGTFGGASTFLSKHFVVNPLLFMKERKAFIETHGFHPHVYVDPRCIITTPYDMLLNQAYEKNRGDAKHGSCGVGFGETLERQKHGYELTVEDIHAGFTRVLTDKYKEWLIDRVLIALEEIRDGYIKEKIDMDSVDEDFIQLLNSEGLVTDFITACDYLLQNTSLSKPNYFKDDALIFEGAQGLLLDQDYGYFPHVTRSNTGMRNVSQILSEIDGEHDVTVNYVTRAYTTRHGAGPLAEERPDMPKYYNIVDETNVPNEFQGTLRYGVLDWDLLTSITNKDFLNYAPLGAKKILTVTCVDQLNPEGVAAFMENRTEDVKYVSYGPTRKDILELEIE